MTPEVEVGCLLAASPTQTHKASGRGEAAIIHARIPTMRLEFLLCGSPVDAFWSQCAMFRRSLDSLGPLYEAARLVIAVEAPDSNCLPHGWKPYFRNIEVVGAGNRPEPPHAPQYWAQSDIVYDLLDDGADVSFICDADVLPMAPLPQAFLGSFKSRPAVCGVPAHVPPYLQDGLGRAVFEKPPSSRELWDFFSTRILGKRIMLPFTYTLQESGAKEPCPFYINYGVFAGPPRMLRELHRELTAIEPQVISLLNNDFYGQIALSLAVERIGMPCRALPMRYNFPNDPLADRLYPRELEQVLFMHYLRMNVFDRHKIFAAPTEFEAFLRLDLSGSNAVFRDRIARLCSGIYPFPRGAGSASKVAPSA